LAHETSALQVIPITDTAIALRTRRIVDGPRTEPPAPAPRPDLAEPGGQRRTRRPRTGAQWPEIIHRISRMTSLIRMNGALSASRPDREQRMSCGRSTPAQACISSTSVRGAGLRRDWFSANGTSDR
jgi:hypothetical protein